MKILVTGGTGFLGQYVVKKLLEKKQDVVIFCRNKKGEGNFVLGDIRNKEDLEKAFPADVVIHLAASTDDYEKGIKEINVGGTQNVVDLCKKYDVKQLIHMSSTGAIGEIQIAKEDSDRNPKSKYEKSKKDAEDIIMTSRLNYTIIRAPVIIGPSSNWMSVIKAAQKKFPLIGKGDNRFHLAYVEDVAGIIIRCIGNKKAVGQIFHVATKDVPTYKEFYSMLCDALGTEMTKKSMPVFLVKIISSVHEISRRLQGKKPKPTLARSNIDRITRDRIVSIEKAKDVLDFEPKYDTRQAVQETVEHFKKSGMI